METHILYPPQGSVIPYPRLLDLQSRDSLPTALTFPEPFQLCVAYLFIVPGDLNRSLVEGQGGVGPG